MTLPMSHDTEEGSIIEVHVLQCLFVRGSNINKGGVALFQISQKERLFHLL